MHVKLLTGRCANVNGITVSQKRGQTVEVSVREAFRMIDAGQAEAVGPLPPRPAPEKVVEPTPIATDEDDDSEPSINDPPRPIASGDSIDQLDLSDRILESLHAAELSSIESLRSAVQSGAIHEVNGIGKMTVDKITLALQRFDESRTT